MGPDWAMTLHTPSVMKVYTAHSATVSGVDTKLTPLDSSSSQALALTQ